MLQIQTGEERKSALLNKDDYNGSNATLSLCAGISYTLHVFMFCKHMQVLLKGYGLFLCLLNPIWPSRLAEGRNNLGTANENALCPF